MHNLPSQVLLRGPRSQNAARSPHFVSSSLRRGVISHGILVKLAAVGLLGASGAIFGVTTLESDGNEPPRVAAVHAGAARTPFTERGSRRSSLERLRRLIDGSREVLAIRPRDVSPYLDLILWSSDDVDPGQINLSEITVVSHHPALRMLGAYVMRGAEAKTEVFDRANLLDPIFCDRWRGNPQVQMTTLAIGVSDVLLETISGESGFANRVSTGDSPRRDSGIGNPNAQWRFPNGDFRIEVIWRGDSADSDGSEPPRVGAVEPGMTRTALTQRSSLRPQEEINQ